MKVAMVEQVSTTTISRIRLNTKAIHNVTQLHQMVQILMVGIKKTAISGLHMDMGSSNSSNNSFIIKKWCNRWSNLARALGCASISITLTQSCSLIALDSTWEGAQIQG